MKAALVGSVLCCAVLALGATAQSQPTTRAASRPAAPARDLSGLIAPILARHKVPGLAGAIVEPQGVTGIGVAGVRKAGAPGAIQRGDLFHLGSDTKSMTAVLVAQLVEAGTLRLDSPMSEVFPELAAKMNAEMAKTTVAQVLAHRAGFPANVNWSAFAVRPGTMVEKRRAVVEELLGAAPLSPPGSQKLYSNAGYMLLGAIVERAAKQPWEEAITARLFRPLGMGSARFGPVPKAGQPWGHVAKGDVYEPIQIDNPAPLGPAGTVHCTLADWGKYIAFCLRASEGDTPLLKAETYRQVVTPEFGGEYAGGWAITQRPWGGGRVLTHAGSNTTWFCVAWVAPNRGFAVLAACNAAGPDATAACDDVASALIGERARLATGK